MKKLLSMMLVLCLLLALGACGSTVNNRKNAQTSTTTKITETDTSGLDDRTVAAGETWEIEDNCNVGRLEIEADATVEADFPVIVFFDESDTVSNGEVIGNVQFVSEYDEIVAIVHTNDTHGHIQNEPYVKGLADHLKATGEYSLVLTVNAGDVYAGGYAAAHIYNGEYIPAIMSKIYDYMTWGNTDAALTGLGMQTYLLAAIGNTLGLTTLLANQNASAALDLAAYAASYTPTIGAEAFVALYPDILTLNNEGSIDWSALDLGSYALASGDNALDDTAVVETENGTKIGLFGLSTQGGSITDAYFAGGQSTITVSQAYSDKLAAECANVVIEICHTGWFSADSTDTSSNDTNSAQIALNTTGIDAIIDGHTHSIINEGEGWLFSGKGDQPIVNQAACYGQAIGVMYLYIKDGECIAKDCEVIKGTDYTNGLADIITPDPGVQAVVDACFDQLGTDGYTEVLAVSEYFLNGTRISEGDVGGGVRANETNLGDLVADGVLYKAQQIWEGDPISIAMYPGFWVRSSVDAGEIDKIDILSVFANPLVIYYSAFTASELVSELERQISKIGQERNEFCQVAGLTLTYDKDTKDIVTVTVAGKLIYQNGVYLVGDDWTVGVAETKCGGDLSYPEGMLIVESNIAMADAFCDFLKNADYTIYPNEVGAGGRIVPAE